MTDRPGPPLALDPFAVLEPAIVVVRAETEAREGLQALLEQVYGLQEPAIHLLDEPLALGRGRLLLPGGSEALRVTAAGPPDTVAAARGVVTVLLALAPLLRDVERKADTRAVLQSMQASNGGLLGVAPVMRQLHERIARAARQSFTVLIQGESGAGKELVARQVHAMSARSSGPFVPINCAAIVESLLEAELFGIEERTATGVRGRRGRFEQADGGTLFLDEVSDLSASAQAKLLRIIQDPTVERVGGQGSRRVDVRIVAATNRPLQALCKTGEFRRDLFYRLNAIEIDVPPLRARRDDIPFLCEAILQRSGAGQSYRFAPHALEALMVYEWPGNVRELERVIERAITLARGDTIQVDDLPGDVTGRYRETYAACDDLDDTMRAWGSRHAKVILRRTRGNKREACRILDISYHTLQSYLTYKGTRHRQPDDEHTPRVTYATPPATGAAAMVHDGPADEARHLDTTVLE